ncbi:ABC transporter permease subunit [Pseudothermotoga thermarum]|uniref:ABC-2 type transport system permease protein n=1 Tax=Pseudothermotoga thermarum DSM 5069 TaxID=688269 RepID=F7YXF0_9THEM|nr:ABC transporter permease subunit [Pseudothermotoga thermarum]AEH51802.1 hypothetical protein Theth_1758 [Pseudothermotoga thermarum DSM 5069]
MNVLKWELKMNFKSFLFWTVFLVGMQFVYFSAFPSFAGEEGLFATKLQLLPAVFRKLFGLDKIDFSDILHFFALQGQIFVFLVASFFGGRLASSIVCKEEHDKTAEFILTRSLTRRRYILEKFLAVTIYLFLFDLILTAANYIYFQTYKVKPFDVKLMLQLVAAYWGVHMFVAAVGFLISVVSRKRTSADSQILFFIFGFYFLSVIPRITEKFKILANFTPFGFFDPAEIVKTRQFNITALILTIVFFLSSALISILYYERKDIY